MNDQHPQQPGRPGFQAPGGPGGQPGSGPGQQPPGHGQPGQPGQWQPGQPGPWQPGQGQQPPGYGQAPGQPWQQRPGQPGGPGQPPPGYGPTPGGPGQPGRKSRTGLIIGIAAGALVLVLLATIGLVAALRGGDGDVAASPGGGDAGQTPEQTVQGYLQAISESRATDALGYLDRAPDDTSLLTDAVLQESNAIAPLGGITVTPVRVDDYSAEISASYTLGSEAVTATYRLFRGPDEEWSLSNGTATAGAYSVKGIDITVNGATPEDPQQMEVFPGSYRLDTTAERFAVENGEFTITSPEDYEGGSLSDLEVVLEEESAELFRRLVTEAAEACVASKKLEAGCGLDLPATLDDGTKLEDGTIERSMPPDTKANLKSLEYELSSQNPTLVSTYDYLGSVDVQAGECEVGGRRMRDCEILFGPSFGTPTVDMAAEDPAVEWS
ncbi:hypothetical protein DT076_15335 [Desertihabitans brevis]|uniref:DUF4878 domain-containing protein n=1 Tax=Desertihabitans brevis TaxID=2268447 RepID=A0A367YS25_9ACTN|nr:hypothetical protein [Desertihabitans brevis]RCK68600.1 hypothetical protein DT076_15335 [Desertihabitans brevis]